MVNTENKAVHFILQGKGGVGKSLVASLIAQYFSENGISIACVDTDPVNQTFSRYKSLNVTFLELMIGSKINERNFDALMQSLLIDSELFIVDNGASSFIPLTNYLIENSAVDMLREHGKKVIIHTIITGGQALLETLAGFNSLAESGNFDNIVVWLNEFFGPVEADGKGFLEMKAYTKHKEKISGVIRIARQNSDTFGKDIEEMTTRRLTFNEAIESADFSIMAKQRLKLFKRGIFDQLAEVL